MTTPYRGAPDAQGPYPYPAQPASQPSAHPATQPTAQPATQADLRAATALTGMLLGLGVLLGVVWGQIAPATSGVVVPLGGVFTDENEALIGGDGRYLFLTAGAGLVSGVAAWLWARHRGPLVALALILGGLAGASATQLAGRLTDGADAGTPRTLTDGSVGLVSSHLPLEVHTVGLVFVWPALAALVYGMCAAFAAQDDLGRPDPVRDRLVPPPVPAPFASIHPGRDAQYGGGHGDAARPLQQGDLPPQQP